MTETTTRAELQEELTCLRIHMVSVAEQMKHFGGFNAEANQHAAELLGAAKMLGQWSRELKRKKATRKKAGAK